MERNIFAVHLIPSRPDFAMTMTDEERSIMEQHVAYWMTLFKKGQVYAFGPVNKYEYFPMKAVVPEILNQ